MFKKDSYVQHPGMPVWGIGKVLEDVLTDKARVFSRAISKIKL